MSAASRRSASTRWRPTRATCTRCCIAGDDEQKERCLRPLAEGRDPLVLRDDRARRGVQRPDEPADDRGPRRRRVGHQRPQVVHHRRRSARRSAIVVAKTGTDEAAGAPQLLADPRARPTRPAGRSSATPEWMGSHSPGGHPIIALDDVRVPAENLLGAEGEGFVIAQKRLAGGRLGHAMRWIGVAQRALDLSRRAAARAQGVRQAAGAATRRCSSSSPTARSTSTRRG